MPKVRILHAGKLVRGGRRRRLKIPATWPWANAIVAAWARITAPATSPLTGSKPSLRARKEQPGARGTPAAGPPAGPPSYPDPKIKIPTQPRRPLGPTRDPDE